MDIAENSQFKNLTRSRANEILAEASALVVANPSLRLGQAICNVSTSEDWECAWPELFNEEDPAKAADIFYNAVENRGRRELTGSLSCGWFNLPESRP